MPSHTPNFDAALDKLFADLKPHTRICTETGESLEITARDIEMLKLLRVPPPTAVWWSAIRRMRSFMAGFDLFRRTLPDGQSVVSMYDPESPVPVMLTGAWNADTNDLLAYARAIDPGSSFFTQWNGFSNSIPRPAMVQDMKSVGSDYSPYAAGFKDCYYTYSGLNCENLLYSDLCILSKHGADLTTCGPCEWCYESVLCQSCSRVFFSERCDDCVDVAFSFGCRNCTDCFGCTNLRNKKFCFLNEQLTEEEFKKRRAAIDLSDARVVAEWTERAQTLWHTTFRRGGGVFHSESSAGEDIGNCQQVYGVGIWESQRSRHGFGANKVKDSMSFTEANYLELCYDIVWGAKLSNCVAAIGCANCVGVEYSEIMFSCENCFGCIGLTHKKFCIFNKQYTEEEYWPIVDAVKTAMLERGEYGEFFPYSASPFAFNLAFGNALYPTSEKEARKLGGRWYVMKDEAAANALDIGEIPERLADTTDEILNKRFRCPETGRSFLFVKPELEFHRTLGLALPRLHPTARRTRRMAQLLPPRLYPRVCDSCKTKIETTIPPTVTTPVFCQSCYEKVVIGERPAPATT